MRAPLTLPTLESRPPERHGRWRLTTFSVSTVGHAGLVFALLVAPLFTQEPLALAQSVRTFLVAPPAITPPPPPPAPPPPSRGLGAAGRPAAAPKDTTLRLPETTPDTVQPEASELDSGVVGGDPNGIEGGVEFGVSGAIVGGAAPTPAGPVAIVPGGSIRPPRLVHRVNPIYPARARQAGITGTVILQALVNREGIVREVQVVSGFPMLAQAAVAAVSQWRYQPLLLNGQRYEFTLAVEVTFGLG